MASIMRDQADEDEEEEEEGEGDWDRRAWRRRDFKTVSFKRGKVLVTREAKLSSSSFSFLS